jgi:hypothetical protein
MVVFVEYDSDSIRIDHGAMVVLVERLGEASLSRLRPTDAAAADNAVAEDVGPVEHDARRPGSTLVESGRHDLAVRSGDSATGASASTAAPAAE